MDANPRAVGFTRFNLALNGLLGRLYKQMSSLATTQDSVVYFHPPPPPHDEMYEWVHTAQASRGLKYTEHVIPAFQSLAA